MADNIEIGRLGEVQNYVKKKLEEKGYDNSFAFYSFALDRFNQANCMDDAWEIILELVKEQTVERQTKFWDSYLKQLKSKIEPVKEFKPIEKFPHIIKDLKACYQLTLYPSISPKGRYELYTYDEDEGKTLMNFSIDDGKLTYYYGNFDGVPDSYSDDVVDRMCELFNVKIDGKGWENKNIIFRN